MLSIYYLSTLLCAISANAATISIIPPAPQGVLYSSGNTLDFIGEEKDISIVVSTVGASSCQTKTARRHLERRQSPSILSTYQQVFEGTGPVGSVNVTDAAIQGTAYLTYSIVSNTTYNVEDCLAHCNSVDGCVFANLYYELNNYSLDFDHQSNLKCALYSDVYNNSEKTDFGGQQSYPSPAPLTYIQDSSGWFALSLMNPPNPPGYDLVFGPVNFASKAPGYMGFSFLNSYDVNACAQLCNTRNPDPEGGPCQYFNIWRAVVLGIPTTYTCSLYYIPTDESTATADGQGDLQVTYSRGYRRI